MRDRSYRQGMACRRVQRISNTKDGASKGTQDEGRGQPVPGHRGLWRRFGRLSKKASIWRAYAPREPRRHDR